MDKIMVSVMVPSLDMRYDISLPRFMTIEEITCLLAEALSGATGKVYTHSNGELLCWFEKGTVLNREKTIAEYGIQNGDLLYLY